MCKKITSQEKRLGWSLQILVEAISFKDQLYKTSLDLRQTNKILQVIEIEALLVQMVKDQSELGVQAAN